MDNTKENNILLAEFMGGIYKKTENVIPHYTDPARGTAKLKGYYKSESEIIDFTNSDFFKKYRYVTVERLEFHSSYDWIMKVFEKISETHIIELNTMNSIRIFEKKEFRPLILSVSSIPNPNASNPPTKENPMFIFEFENNFDLIYNSCLRFIKWYNLNK